MKQLTTYAYYIPHHSALSHRGIPCPHRPYTKARTFPHRLQVSDSGPDIEVGPDIGRHTGDIRPPVRLSPMYESPAKTAEFAERSAKMRQRLNMTES